MRYAMTVLMVVGMAVQAFAAAGNDHDAVLAASKKYLIAFGSADPALRATLAGRDKDEDHAADIFVDSWLAQYRLGKVIYEKLGPAAHKEFYGNERKTPPTPQEREAKIDAQLKAAKVEIAGNAARVTPMGATNRRDTVWLIRLNGEWKVWICGVLQYREKEMLDNYVKLNWYYGQVYNKLADLVVGGQLTLVDSIRDMHSTLERRAEESASPASRPAAAITVTRPEDLQTGKEIGERLRRQAELEKNAAELPLAEQKIMP